MTEKDCSSVEEFTRSQSKNYDWYEIRYGRITASKFFEASRCTVVDGSLLENLMGGTAVMETMAIIRGKQLADKVLKEVAKIRRIKIINVGIFIGSQNPIFGAAPDGLSEDFCIEIKCPYKDATVVNYIKDGKLTNTAMAQIQLQMHFCKRTKGLFCIASSNFENNKVVTIIDVQYDEGW